MRPRLRASGQRDPARRPDSAKTAAGHPNEMDRYNPTEAWCWRRIEAKNILRRSPNGRPEMARFPATVWPDANRIAPERSRSKTRGRTERAATRGTPERPQPVSDGGFAHD